MCSFSSWENLLSPSFSPGFLFLGKGPSGGTDICIGKSGRVCSHFKGNINGGGFGEGHLGKFEESDDTRSLEKELPEELMNCHQGMGTTP